MAIQDAIKENTDVKIKKPEQYKVTMYNDDFTPMDFVVEILIDIFHKSPPEAVDIMFHVHRNGSATVGVYTYDIAKTKEMLAVSRAREEGYPFRLQTEKA